MEAKSAPPAKASSRTRSERKLAWMLCAPAVVAMLLVTAYPIAYAIVLSLQDVDLVKSIKAGKPLNEAQQIAESSLTAVMGRMSAYTGKTVTKAYPGFAPLVKESIEESGPRPTTPAYQDVSLAVQRALHPPDKIDSSDTESIYDELKSKVEDAVKREGLL